MANKRTIRVELSQESIAQAINEIQRYKIDVMNKSKLLAKRLAEIGVGIAQMYISDYDAIDTGELQSSITLKSGMVFQDGAQFYIYTDCPYAPFVEFGTGIVGMKLSHPQANDYGWKYDSHNHGNHGWFYYKNGSFHWSNGYESRPFMLETYWELGKRVSEIAREVFSQ